MDIADIILEVKQLEITESSIIVFEIDTNDTEVLDSPEMDDTIDAIDQLIKTTTGLEVPILIFNKDIALSCHSTAEIRKLCDQIDEGNNIEEDDDFMDIFN